MSTTSQWGYFPKEDSLGLLRPVSPIRNLPVRNQIGQVSESKPPKHHCQICLKTVTEKNEALAHLQIHNGEDAFCVICEKQFVRESLLERHYSQKIGYFCRTALADLWRQTKPGDPDQKRGEAGRRLLKTQTLTSGSTRKRPLESVLSGDPKSTIVSKRTKLNEKGALFNVTSAKDHSGLTLSSVVNTQACSSPFRDMDPSLLFRSRISGKYLGFCNIKDMREIKRYAQGYRLPFWCESEFNTWWSGCTAKTDFNEFYNILGLNHRSSNPEAVQAIKAAIGKAAAPTAKPRKMRIKRNR